MKGPGRESAASLSVAPVTGLPERPEPLPHLTEEEAAEWRAIVSTKPADWFMRDSQPVLAAYCQAICMNRDLVEMWNNEKGKLESAILLKDLISSVTKTSNLVAQLATKLRLTQQSRYTAQSAATANKRAANARPWE
jgi:hypothetical protein